VALAGGLRARGWETVAVLPDRGDLASRLEGADVEVVVHPLAVLRRRLLEPSGLIRLALAARRERTTLERLAHAAAVVHSNTSVMVWRPRGVAHVVHVREIYAGAGAGLTARAWPLWRRRLMRADARICVSGAVADQFNSSDQGWGDGTFVVHDGLARGEQYRPAHRMGGQDRIAPFRVAVLGRIADWKGQDVLIRSLAEPFLADIGAVAVIAGDAYPGERAPDVEALAGLLVRPGDHVALANALRKLADDPERRARMGAAAAGDARERFGLERMLDEIEGVYASLGVRR
jgi:glycosyltransferase involved in cell wall biosynthesis